MRTGEEAVQLSEEDSYVCEECGAGYNTYLERWRLPRLCWDCGTRHPWVRADKSGSRKSEQTEIEWFYI